MSENTKKKMTREELFNKLNELQSSYKEKIDAVAPKKLQLKKMDYTAPTDNELEKLVRESLESKYGKALNDAKSTVDNKKLVLESEIEKALKNSEKEVEGLKENYTSSKNEIENQALKRGVQRSSVVMNELGELEKQKQNNLSQIMKESQNTIDGLNVEIDNLQKKLDKSLKELDMQQSFEINEKLTELKNERDDKLEEVMKYNNQIVEKETSYNNKLELMPPDEKTKEIEFELSTKKLATVLDYYLSYDDPQKALEDFLAEPEIAEYLGDFYNYVYNALSAR